MEKTSYKKPTGEKTLKKSKLAKSNLDFGFLFTVIILLALGLLMVFSASYPYAYYYFEDGLYFIKKQLLWTALGTVAMIATANYPYQKYKKNAPLILGITAVLLLAVLAVGINLNGAKRWLGFGGFTFQPSEVAKLGLVIFFAASLSQIKDKIKEFNYLIRYFIIMGVFMGLLLLEPHFSVCIIIGLTLVIMLYSAGAKLLHFGIIGIPFAAAGAFIAILEPYRMKRLLIFTNPESDPLGAGWQILQSLYAIGSGGLFGVGFGNSRQKFMYISEPQNDFIFSIICEELGLIGAIGILVLFAVLFWRGMKIAVSAPDDFGSMLVTGIIALIGVQVVLNIAVVTSSIPTTGIPLPFFSAGGSSLVFIMAAMGIVLNVSRYKKQTI